MDDTLGDRMKGYELQEAGRRFLPLLPVLARMDGRCFSAFTRGMTQPWDKRLSQCMQHVTLKLVRDTNASMGYTQSDEITLVWHATDPESQIFFDGRVAKMTSVLASLTTLSFYLALQHYLPEYQIRLPMFDARVWTVPNRSEAANVFLWREWDATKNSISAAARCFYSHKELYGKNSKELQELLHAKGVNWNDYPTPFKRGVYVQRRKVSTPWTREELDGLPPLHQARLNPDLVVERTTYRFLDDMPPFARVPNREAVMFDGAEPQLME
jgi:tRNA(His) 5'-end guanylyltransferase